MLYKKVLNQKGLNGIGEFAIWCLGCLLVVNTLSGNLDLNRLVGTTAFPRVSVGVLSLFLSLPIIAIANADNKPTFDKCIFSAALAGLLFYAGVLIRAGLDTKSYQYSDLYIKAIYLMLSILALAWACAKWKEAFVYIFAVVCVCMASIWASIWMFRCHEVGCSQEAISFGSAFTFYRIQLIGFFCALYLWSNSQSNSKGLLWLSLSVLLVIACLGSLSKAAWLASTAAIFFYAIVQFIWYSPKQALVVISLFIAGGFVSYKNIGYAIEQRVEHVAKGTGHTSQNMKLLGNDMSKAAIMSLNAINGNKKQLESLPPESRYALEDFLQHHVVITDLSYRLRLIKTGLEGGAVAPLYGNGFESFRYEGVNLYTKETEIYRYPHNILIDVFYTSGVVGVLWFIFCIVLSLCAVLRKRDNVAKSIPFLSAAVGVFTGALFAGDIWDFSLFWILLIVATASLSNSVVEIRHNRK